MREMVRDVEKRQEKTKREDTPPFRFEKIFVWGAKRNETKKRKKKCARTTMASHLCTTR